MAGTYDITYHLALDAGRQASYTLTIDEDTQLAPPPQGPLPAEWATLAEGPCDGCGYRDGEHDPLVIRLIGAVQAFNGLLSHERALVTVRTRERDYVKHTDVQDALRSLFGLIMATSGCPALKPFRFMARHHLPFASVEETIARITSSYLLQQMFRHEGEAAIPFSLKDIEALYVTMQTLNEGMAKRLKKATQGDGSLNAIVILSSYSSLVPIMIRDEMAKLKKIMS